MLTFIIFYDIISLVKKNNKLIMEKDIKIEVEKNVIKVHLIGTYSSRYNVKTGKFETNDKYEVIVIFDLDKSKDREKLEHLVKYCGCILHFNKNCLTNLPNGLKLKNLHFDHSNNKRAFFIAEYILTNYHKAQNNSNHSFIGSRMKAENYNSIFYEKDFFKHIIVNGKRLDQNNNQPNNNNNELTNLMDTTQQIGAQANQLPKSTSKDNVSSAINDLDQSEQSKSSSKDPFFISD